MSPLHPLIVLNPPQRHLKINNERTNYQLLTASILHFYTLFAPNFILLAACIHFSNTGGQPVFSEAFILCSNYNYGGPYPIHVFLSLSVSHSIKHTR